jgi:hypothetical protein
MQQSRWQDPSHFLLVDLLVIEGDPVPGSGVRGQDRPAQLRRALAALEPDDALMVTRLDRQAPPGVRFAVRGNTYPPASRHCREVGNIAGCDSCDTREDSL